MDRWVWYAILSMIFAGCTSVIAKKGLVGISGELGLAVRTVFVFGLIAIFASMFVRRAELQLLTARNYWFPRAFWSHDCCVLDFLLQSPQAGRRRYNRDHR